MNPSKLGISIATRDRWQDVANTLSMIAARAELGKCPVIVIDDGSEEHAPPELRERHPLAQFIRSERSLGASAERTRIARLLATELVLQLDDDSYPVEGSVSDAVAFLDGRPEVISLALNIAFGNSPDPTIPRSEEPYPVDLFVGCGVIYRRLPFLEVGGYSSALGYYFEEHHFCANAFRLGWSTYIYPSLVVRHEKSQSARNLGRIAYYKGRNRVLLVLWHFPLRVIPLKMATSLPGTLALVAPRDYGAAVKGFLVGLFDGLRMIGERHALPYGRYRVWRHLASCYTPRNGAPTH